MNDEERLKGEIAYLKEQMNFCYFMVKKEEKINPDKSLFYLARGKFFLDLCKEKEKELEELLNNKVDF